MATFLILKADKKKAAVGRRYVATHTQISDITTDMTR